MTRFATFLIVLLSAAPVSAQVVGQGAPATTSDATAWPIKVVFGGAQIDPRAVTVQNASIAVTGTFWQATQPVSGTISVSNFPVSFEVSNFPTTPSTSAISVRCVNTAGNAFEACGGGGGSTGQQTMANSAPVVIASDQSAVAVSGPLTDAQLRASAVPVSGTVSVGTFPDNEPINVAQINGVAPSMGNGLSGTGTQRVTLAADSTGQVAINGTPNVNLSQIAGNTVSTGVGASGTGTQRTASLIHDGTDTAQVTATSGGSLQVECTSGCGSAATSNTIAIGLAESVAAPTAATWYIKRQWAVPGSAVFVPSRAWSTVTTAGTRTMVAISNTLGTFNVSSNVFTDGNSVASPRHYTRLFACVTTALSAVATNVTVTYTDELGNTGNTTTALTIPASAPVGNCFEFQLAATTGQMRDVGVRDVTAVSDTAAPTGVIEIHGHNALLDAQGVANALEQTTYDTAQVVSPEVVEILFHQAATTAQQRGAHLFGAIR